MNHPETISTTADARVRQAKTAIGLLAG